ncbi:hypothetical protein DM860_012439 [Cuscuta australis]|uniref:Strictosidine synthase conserved region domain-containing protein n=1 Tax=Cuscuta australis TaxID=267555 RepID=A0A328DFK0_9ASTE|nr:hypothetical protein DM860_012439 [Cuscuta australis]
MALFLSSSSWVLFVLVILTAGVVSLPDVKNYHQINLPAGVVGPESLAFDCYVKGPYTGVSDGGGGRNRPVRYRNRRSGNRNRYRPARYTIRLLGVAVPEPAVPELEPSRNRTVSTPRWEKQEKIWVEFAVTNPNRDRALCDGTSDPSREPLCGRPLGLKFHPTTCELYIADAYLGLMKVGQNGGITTLLANSTQGVPFKFLNDLDIHPTTGLVYFTDSSTQYQRMNFSEIISNADAMGRLLSFDPNTAQVRVLYSGLAFPNGVVLSADSTYLLVVESTRNRILRFPLSRYGIGSPSVFATVDRFPDNIRRNYPGDYWVALNRPRGGYTESPVGVVLDGNGRAIQTVNGNDGNNLEFVSEIEEHNGRMWFGSPRQPYVGTGTSS